MSLGQRIKQLRKEKGFTQAQLGELLGKGDSTVRMWELDKSSPTPHTIRAICGVFRVTPNRLIGNYDLNRLASIEDKPMSERTKQERDVYNFYTSEIAAADSNHSIKVIKNGYFLEDYIHDATPEDVKKTLDELDQMIKLLKNQPEIEIKSEESDNEVHPKR